MKSALVLALTLMAAASFASEKNTTKCDSEFNQNALKCQKMSQFCGRVGPAESTRYELCMEEVYQCIDEGREAYKACLEKPENK